jgi:hypothetical protein
MAGTNHPLLRAWSELVRRTLTWAEFSAILFFVSTLALTTGSFINLLLAFGKL